MDDLEYDSQDDSLPENADSGDETQDDGDTAASQVSQSDIATQDPTAMFDMSTPPSPNMIPPTQPPAPRRKKNEKTPLREKNSAQGTPRSRPSSRADEGETGEFAVATTQLAKAISNLRPPAPPPVPRTVQSSKRESHIRLFMESMIVPVVNLNDKWKNKCLMMIHQAIVQCEEGMELDQNRSTCSTPSSMASMSSPPPALGPVPPGPQVVNPQPLTPLRPVPSAGNPPIMQMLESVNNYPNVAPFGMENYNFQ